MDAWVRRVFTTGAALIAVLPALATATQIIPLTLGQTVSEASSIVTARVVSTQARWGDNSRRWIETDVTIEVEDSILDGGGFGRGRRQTLRFWGGTIGDETQGVAGLHTPETGERFVLMLKANGAGGVTPVVGLTQGMFAVRRDPASGVDMVTEADGSRLRTTATAVALRFAAASGVAGASGGGISLEAFVGGIRADFAALRATPVASFANADPKQSLPRLLPRISFNTDFPDSMPPASEPAGSFVVPPPPVDTPVVIADTIVEGRAKYTSFGRPIVPVTMNPLPPNFSLAPQDQHAMLRWNYYRDDMFRIRPSTGAYGWPDGSFDVAGFPPNADRQYVYGSSWASNELAVCIYRMSGGRILEADVLVNPAFNWTLNDASIYVGNPAERGYRQTIAHELGHVVGLDHNFSDLSLMNYSPSVYRMFGLPYSDDAEAVRASYGDTARTDLGIYLYRSNGFQSFVDATYPTSLTAGDPLTITNFHLENVGTTSANATVEWYLTTGLDFTNAVYLGSRNYGPLARFTRFDTNSISASLPLPRTLPGGTYRLAAFIRDDGGPTQPVFPFSNNAAFSRRTIQISSHPCPNQLGATAVTFSASGGGGTVSLTTGVGCTWNVTSNSAFITRTSASSGSGSTTVIYNVAANGTTSTRTGTLTIAGQTFTVTQLGLPPCTYSLTPPSVSLGNIGDAGTITVTTASHCPWSAVSNAGFIGVQNSSLRLGAGTLPFSIATNYTRAIRSGTATIAGQTFTVTQAAAPTLRLAPDVNNDNFFDLIWQNRQGGGYLAAWMMNGLNLSDSALFNPAQISDPNWRVAATADMDGDGKMDLIFQEETQGWIGIWKMNGLNLVTSLAISVERVPDTDWKIVGAQDFNNDGKADLLWHHRTQGYIALWYMNGVTLVASELFSPGRVADTNWQPEAAADFNSDGRPDLLWRHQTEGWIVVWFMDGLTLTASRDMFPERVSDTNWRIAAIGDVNRDNMPDLIWHDIVNGWIGVWLMNGHALASSIAFNPERVPDVNWRIVGPK